MRLSFELLSVKHFLEHADEVLLGLPRIDVVADFRKLGSHVLFSEPLVEVGGKAAI